MHSSDTDLMFRGRPTIPNGELAYAQVFATTLRPVSDAGTAHVGDPGVRSSGLRHGLGSLSHHESGVSING